jgi:hypothetical protein
MMRMNLGEMFVETNQHWKYALLRSITLEQELEEDQMGEGEEGWEGRTVIGPFNSSATLETTTQESACGRFRKPLFSCLFLLLQWP